MKAKFGAIVVDGRGKIGGHVASKNRGGSYFRTKVTPTNPRTTAQNAVRNRLSSLSQGWKGLTEAQRAAWNAAVSNFTSTNIFGDIKTPTGLNLYVRLNSNILEVGGIAITNPPLPASITGLTEFSVAPAAGAGSMAVTFAATPVALGTKMIIRATPQVSPGKSFVKNLYRNIAILDAGDTTGEDIHGKYVAKFGALVAGQKIGYEAIIVKESTGQKTTAVSYLAVVAA